MQPRIMANCFGYEGVLSLDKLKYDIPYIKKKEKASLYDSLRFTHAFVQVGKK